MSANETIFKIIPENLPYLQEKLAKLSKRAVKLGLDPIKLEVLGTVMVNIEDHNQTTNDLGQVVNETTSRIEQRIEITVTGPQPKLNGWAIAAVIEHHTEGNIFRAVPPYTTDNFDVKFRTSDSICEHCKMDRRRKDTYIVRSDDGQQVQVGRSCLKDFTGHASPEAIASFAETLSMLPEMVNEAGSRGGSGVPYFETEKVLNLAACVVRRDGFVSRAAQIQSDYTKTSTSGTVSQLLSPISPLLKGAERAAEIAWRNSYAIIESDVEKASLAREWAITLTDMSNDYLWNLHVVASMEHVTFKNFGILVSLISAYQRNVEKLEREQKIRNERPVSHHVGTEGKREEFAITLKKKVSRDNGYGTTYMHFFEDVNGNQLTWFASNASDMWEGTTYVVKATVKKHDVYKGENKTLLNRVTVLREIETPQQPEMPLSQITANEAMTVEF